MAARVFSWDSMRAFITPIHLLSLSVALLFGGCERTERRPPELQNKYGDIVQSSSPRPAPVSQPKAAISGGDFSESPLQRVQQQVIERYLASQNAGQAYRTCRMYGGFDADSRALKRLCAEARSASIRDVESTENELRHARDHFTETDYQARCIDFRLLVKDVLPEREAAVIALCSELQISRWLRQIEEELVARSKALSTVLPYQCSMVASALEALSSAWSTKARAKYERTCSRYPDRFIDEFSRQWRIQRDTPDSDISNWSCFALDVMRPKLTKAKQRLAVTLCAEVHAEKSARNAISAARDRISKKRPLIPYDCRKASKRLSGLMGAWARLRLKAVVEACYVRLGRRIIESYPKSRYLACPFGLQQWFDEAVGYRAKDPALDDLVRSTTTRCQRE